MLLQGPDYFSWYTHMSTSEADLKVLNNFYNYRQVNQCFGLEFPHLRKVSLNLNTVYSSPFHKIFYITIAVGNH